jgi:hypothetical protein
MINFNQNIPVDSFDREYILLEFIRHFSIGFIKMELLMLFYRYQINVVTAAEIVNRTGYHLHEVNVNLGKLVADQLLASQNPATTPETMLFRRLEPGEFSGRNLIHQILERMAIKFNEREGRLKIIYAILKAQD